MAVIIIPIAIMTIAVALIALVVVGDDTPDTTVGQAPTVTTQAPPPTTAATTAAPTTVAPTPVPPTTLAPTTTTSTTTTTLALQLGWPTDARYLVFGEDGIAALTGSGEYVLITTQPTAYAIGFRDEVILSQVARTFDSTPLTPEGPILVTDSTGTRTLENAAGEEVRLYDVVEIDGRPHALASVVTGYGPQETEEHLVLIDIETSARTDLGLVGGWEATTSSARVAGDKVLVAVGGLPHAIEARSFDGTLLWTTGEASFDRTASFVTTDQAVLQLFPEFRGDDFIPVLVGVGFSLADGTELEPFELELRAEFLGGYCLDVDWDGTRLVCSESYGGPFAVDIETGEVEPFPGLDEGAISSVRR